MCPLVGPPPTRARRRISRAASVLHLQCVSKCEWNKVDLCAGWTICAHAPPPLRILHCCVMTASRQNKHHVDTFSAVLQENCAVRFSFWPKTVFFDMLSIRVRYLFLRYCNRECPPTSTAEPQFGESKCAHTPSRATEGRQGRMRMWLLACGWLGSAASSKACC